MVNFVRIHKTFHLKSKVQHRRSVPAAMFMLSRDSILLPPSYDCSFIPE